MPIKDPVKRKEYSKKYNSIPENKVKQLERQRKRRLKPEVKEQDRKDSLEYSHRPERKIRKKEIASTPEFKEKRNIWYKGYGKLPHIRVINRDRQKIYRSKPENMGKGKGYALKSKINVFEVYSKRISNSDIPCCAYCKLNSHHEFLTIDHIDGRKHLSDEEKNLKADKLYRWLIRNNFPKNYQILCFTCNDIKNIRTPKELSQSIKNIKSRQKNVSNKIEVMTHYSKGEPKCNCCGYFESLDGLSIDHKEGRRKMGHSKKMKGNVLYRFLIKQNFPNDSFQVLCHNCNSAKGHFGKCPHELDKMKN